MNGIKSTPQNLINENNGKTERDDEKNTSIPIYQTITLNKRKKEL